MGAVVGRGVRPGSARRGVAGRSPRRGRSVAVAVGADVLGTPDVAAGEDGAASLGWGCSVGVGTGVGSEVARALGAAVVPGVVGSAVGSALGPAVGSGFGDGPGSELGWELGGGELGSAARIRLRRRARGCRCHGPDLDRVGDPCRREC